MSELERPWREGLGPVEKHHRPMRPDMKLQERLMTCEQLADVLSQQAFGESFQYFDGR